VRRHTDYALARRAVLRDLERGRVSRMEICDAHPELLRAGRHVGEPASQACPVCGGGELRYVSYVYGNNLRQANGCAITDARELERLGAAHDEFTRYVVEVCLACRWNHLARRELHGRRHDDRRGSLRGGRRDADGPTGDTARNPAGDTARDIGADQAAERWRGSPV
jgi:hypothetical protein